MKDKKDPCTHCQNCGRHVLEISQEGKYLRRTNKLGEDFVGICSPCCEFDQGTQETALIDAIEGK